MTTVLRWLHLSDLHQRPDHGRAALYASILAHVDARIRAGQGPHAVFVTGDLAWSGAKAQYQALEAELLGPLRRLVGADCPILMVPGNHDVQRDMGTEPRLAVQTPAALKAVTEASEPGKKRRLGLALRFDDYITYANAHPGFGGDWLRTAEGAAVRRLTAPDGRGVAVVGINTAWLAQDDADRGALTPGADMVRMAVTKAAAGAELVIVLGHHPVDSFIRAEMTAIDGCFAKHKVLYLYGHHHLNAGEMFPAEVLSSYGLQAGAAFQAHDDDQARNGLMWAEADLAGGKVTLEPMSQHPQDGWRCDPWHFPAVFVQDGKVVLPLPGRAAANAAADEGGLGLPDWEELDIGRWAATTPPASLIERFFDGGTPDWPMVVSGGLGRRQMVRRLVEQVDGLGHGAERPILHLLTGPGGEGKSTALRQAAVDLVRAGWSCLVRSRDGVPLPADLGARLPRGRKWLVVVDEADRAVADIAAICTALDRTDVHFLLAARQTDWKAAIERRPLRDVAQVEAPLLLAGLDATDAAMVTAAWQAHANGGRPAVTAEQLAARARSLGHSDDDGSLLGALLDLRFGDRLVDHVRAFLLPLRDYPAPGGRRLLDVYAMIAAMHAEGQTYLSRSVLAYALGCDDDELERQVVRPLAREAAPVSEGTFLLTRHRRIAEAAIQVLRDEVAEFGIDVDRLYPVLAGAATRCFRENWAFVHHLGDWTFALAKHFKVRKPTLAREIARAVFEAEPGNLPSLTAYAAILRETKQPAAAFDLFAAHAERWGRKRGFLTEWATAAGEADRAEFDVWLAARALADDAAEMVDQVRAKTTLAGLGRGCELAAQASGDAVFRRAHAACGRLGLRLTSAVDATSKRYFTHHDKATRDIPPLSDPELYAALRAAAVAAAALAAAADPALAARLSAILGRPEGYGFNALKAHIGPAP